MMDRMDRFPGQHLPRKQTSKLIDWRAKLGGTDEPRSWSHDGIKADGPAAQHLHFGAAFGSVLPSLFFFNTMVCSRLQYL
jgi:hypothetical protein